MEATTYHWITHPWEDTSSLSALWAEKCRKRPATQPYFLLLWTLTLCWDILRVGRTFLIVQKVNNYAAKKFKKENKQYRSTVLQGCRKQQMQTTANADMLLALCTLQSATEEKKKTLGQKCIKNHFIYAPFSTIGELLLQTSPHCLSGYGYTIISSAWNKTTMQFPKCSSQLVFVPNLVLMFHVLSRWGNRSSWEAHREKKKE